MKKKEPNNNTSRPLLMMMMMMIDISIDWLSRAPAFERIRVGYQKRLAVDQKGQATFGGFVRSSTTTSSISGAVPPAPALPAGLPEFLAKLRKPQDTAIANGMRCLCERERKREREKERRGN